MTSFHSPATATHTRHAATVISHATERVLEGAHPWGLVEVSPAGRTTWNRTRLTVYPPGTNHAERRALQFFRTWPLVGAVVALFTMLALSAWPPLVATAVAASIYATGLLSAFRMTAALRPRCRRLVVVTVHLGGGLELLGDVDFYRRATDELRALDLRQQHGSVTPAEYEAGWAEVYNALPDRWSLRR